MEKRVHAEATDEVSLSEPASTFIKRMVRLSGLGANAGFRLVVSPGGCAGLSSSFSVEPAPAAGDHVLAFAGLTVFVPEGSRRLLEGVTIDFVDSPTQTGLVFIDPKAQGCGCSTGPSSVQIGVFR